MPPSASLWRRIFCRRFFAIAHQQRAMLAPDGVEVGTGDGAPAAFLANAGTVLA